MGSTQSPKQTQSEHSTAKNTTHGQIYKKANRISTSTPLKFGQDNPHHITNKPRLHWAERTHTTFTAPTYNQPIIVNQELTHIMSNTQNCGKLQSP
jgi:hypothetical protein